MQLMLYTLFVYFTHTTALTLRQGWEEGNGYLCLRVPQLYYPAPLDIHLYPPCKILGGDLQYHILTFQG